MTKEIKNNKDALTTLKSQPTTDEANKAIVKALESSVSDLTLQLAPVKEDSLRLENQLLEISKQHNLLKKRMKQGEPLSVNEIAEKAPLATVPVAELFAPAAQAKASKSSEKKDVRKNRKARRRARIKNARSHKSKKQNVKNAKKSDKRSNAKNRTNKRTNKKHQNKSKKSLKNKKNKKSKRSQKKNRTQK